MRKVFLLILLFSLQISNSFSQFNCSAAAEISCGQTITSNNLGQCYNFYNGPYCNDNDANYTGREKIYKFNVTANQIVQFTLTNTTADLDMFLTNACAPQSCIAYSYQPGNSATEFISAALTAGTYFLVIDGYAGASSSFNLAFNCTTSNGQLDCSNAQEISCGQTINSTNADGINNVVGPYCGQHCNFTGKEKIYSFTVTNTGSYTIKLTGLTADLDMFLMSSCNRASCTGLSGNAANGSETITKTLTPDTYYIVIDGYKGATSGYALNLTCPTTSPPADCSTLVHNYYSGNGSDLKFGFKFNSTFSCQFKGWKIGSTLYSTHPHVNFIFQTPGTYNVCAEYLDLATNTIKTCCRSICASLPTNCEQNIQHAYVNGKFTLSLAGNAADYTNITWRNDTDKLELDPNNVSPDCREITVSVSYFNKVTNCWTVCCKRISFCPPTTCQDNISAQYSSNGNKFTFSFSHPSATHITWFFDDTKQVIPGGVFALPTGWVCGEKTISIHYYDNITKCWRVCCKKVHLCPPVNCETAIQYQYNSASNKYVFSLTVPNAGNNIWKFDEGNVALPNGEFTVPASWTCANRNVSVEYYDLVNHIWRICTRTIYICPPSNCQDNIKFQYNAAGNKFVFNLEGFSNANVVWKFEDDNVVLPNGEFPLPQNWVCKERNIQAFYYSPAHQCWLVCSKTVTICPPTQCSSTIDFNYVENGNKMVFTLNVPGASHLYWKIDEDNVYIPNGELIFNSSWQCKERTITVIYYDSYTKCWRNCCKKINLCPATSCGNSIDASFIHNSNKYAFTLNNAGASQISWYFSDGTLLPNGEFIIPLGYACQNKTVMAKYFIAATNSWHICQRGVTICPPSQCESAISYNYSPGKVTFNLNNYFATSLTWTMVEGNIPLTNGEFLIPSNWTCGDRTIMVKYHDTQTNCQKICSKKVFICPPANCENNITHEYIPNGNKFHFTLNFPGAHSLEWKLLPDNIVLPNGDFSIPSNWTCGDKTVLVSYYNPQTNCWSMCTKNVNICPPTSCQQSIQFSFNTGGNAITLSLVGVPNAQNVKWILDETKQIIGSGINTGEIPLPHPCGTYTASAIYQVNGTWHTCCKMISMCNPNDCASSISHTATASQISLSLPSGSTDVSWSSNLGITPNGSTASISIPANASLVQVSATYKDIMGVYKTCRKDITINNCNPPVSGFTYTINNNKIQLTNQSQGATSYNWDFAGGVPLTGSANTPNAEIYFLRSGSYNLCLTAHNACGTNTSCQIINVVNDQGCGFNLGNNVCGSAGQVVLVPVSVVNFKNILAFNYTIKSDDGNAAQLIGCEQFNPAIATGNYFFVENDNIRFFWSDPQGKSLPDDAIIFYVKVRLNTTFYHPIKLTFVNDPVKIECFNTQMVQIPVNTSNGSVCINQTASVQGMLTTFDNRPVSNVHLMVNQVDMQTNQNTGNYMINNLSMGTAYDIKPLRNDSPYNGLNGLDIVKLQRHILQIEALDSPYKIIAADVNNDRNLNALDIINLQRMILRMIQEFPNNTSWRFVPKSFIFTQTNPLLSNFPESIQFSPLSSDMNNQDFIAIKIGDLNGSADLNIIENHSYNNRNLTDTMYLSLKNQYISTGQFVSIPVTVKNFRDIVSLENTFNWDTTLVEFSGVSNFALSNLGMQNFGTTLIDRGLLLFSWFDNQASGITLSDNTTLFNINFKLKNNFSGSTEVKLSDAPIAPLCINKNLESIVLKTGNGTITQVSPLAFTTEKSEIKCFGGTNGFLKVNVTGGTGNFVYEWNNGAATQSITDLPVGGYSCKVTDVLTQEKILVNEEITSPDEIKVSLIASQDAGNGEMKIDAIVEGGVPPYNYNWSTGSNNPNIGQLAAGIYSVTITDNNQCVTRAEAEIILSSVSDGSNKSIKLYPNPASHEIFMELGNEGKCDYDYFISNQKGQQIMKGKVQDCLNEKLDVSILEAGIYQIKIKNQDKTIISRFVIMK